MSNKNLLPKLDDNSTMTFGIHEGKKMIDVPDQDLLNYYNQGISHKHPEVHEYIESNLQAIKNNIAIKALSITE